MTPCDATQRAILSDEAASPEPPASRGAEPDHLASCAACRDFASAHRAATGLASIEPRRAMRPRRAAVLLRAFALLVVVTGLGAVSSTSRTPVGPSAEVPSTPARLETELRVATIDQPDSRSARPDHDREWEAFVALHQGLSTDLHRELSVTDHTYSSFGALSQWLAPTAVTVTALED